MRTLLKRSNYSSFDPSLSRCQLAMAAGAALVVVSALVAGIALVLPHSSSSAGVATAGPGLTPGAAAEATTPASPVEEDPADRPPPSGSVLGAYPRAAVASDGKPCAQVGA